MKAVVYHADANFAWGDPVKDTYRNLFRKFREQVNSYGMELIHLTLIGHEGWGDSTIYFDGLEPQNVVLNREECFTQFIEQNEGVFWFCEPDMKINKMWPPLKKDLAMLYRRGDSVPLNPAWKMATNKAAPIFRHLRDNLRALVPYQEPNKEPVDFRWHGDSWAYNKAWKEFGRPTNDFNALGVSIELRDYKDYIKDKGTYSINLFGKKKNEWV